MITRLRDDFRAGRADAERVARTAEPTRAFLVAAALLSGGNFALFWIFERPGLGSSRLLHRDHPRGACDGTSSRRCGRPVGHRALGIGIYVNPHVPITDLPSLARCKDKPLFFLPATWMGLSG